MIGKRSSRSKKAHTQFIEQQIQSLKTQDDETASAKQNPYEQLVGMLNKGNHRAKIQIKNESKLNLKSKESDKGDTSMIAFIQHLKDKPKLNIGLNPDQYENYYIKISEEQAPEKLDKIGKEVHLIQMQSKYFPTVEIKSQRYDIGKLNLNMKYQMASTLMNSSAFHKETLDRIGLLKSFEMYQDQQYLTEKKNFQKDTAQQIKVMGLEFFAMLRTGMDIRVEFENSDEIKRIRDTYILHILDYVIQDRERVHFNDKKIMQEMNKDKVTLDNVFELAKATQEHENSQSSEEENQEEEEVIKVKQDIPHIESNDFITQAISSSEVNQALGETIKDQGFTRPKVLILTPFKQMAYQIVEMIVMLVNGGKWKKVSKKKKFREEFGSEEEAFNDYFKIGLAFNHSKTTDKLTLKLYEQFYKSDILIASPLGLRTLTGQEQDTNAQDQQRIDFDFLSSIEYLVLDQAEAFIFQNVEHFEEILKFINKTPKKLSDLNDISRIKDLYTAQDQKYPKMIRQNIFISKFRNIDLDYSLEQYCNQNIFGQIKLQKIHPNRAKQMCDQFKLKMTLRRLPNVTTFEHADDARFSFFTKQLWDKIYEENPGYTVLFVPSYLDFVRLRTFFRNKNAQVAFISEYSEKKDCQRNRNYYETKEKPILMITERAIIFDKIKLRYARNVVMYGLPESPDTFTDVLCEITNRDNWSIIIKQRMNVIKNSKDKTEDQVIEETQNLMREKNAAKSIVGLFSKFDKYQLERIVGTANFRKFIKNESKDSFSI